MADKNLSAQDSFFELLIKLTENEEDRKDILPHLGVHFRRTFKVQEYIDYASIFRKVCNSQITREDKDIILQILVEVEKQVPEEFQKIMLRKMRNNFSLSFEQKANFDELDNKFKSDLAKAVNDLDTAHNELKIVQEELKKAKIALKGLDQNTSKIYAQFVTILGVFTAIVLSIFGGLQLISASFANLHFNPIWKVVLIASMISIATLSMLFLLTRWVTTIVNKSFGFQSERSLMQLITDNGAFSSGIFIFGYFICTSVAFSSRKFKDNFHSLLNAWDSWPVLIVLSFPLIIGIMIFIKAVDMRKYSSK